MNATEELAVRAWRALRSIAKSAPDLPELQLGGEARSVIEELEKWLMERENGR